MGQARRVGQAKRCPTIGNAQSGRWTNSLVPPYRLPLDSIRRIVVVGAGKAGAGMAQAVEDVFGPELMAEKQLSGWVNVPADCVSTGGKKGTVPICAKPGTDRRLVSGRSGGHRAKLGRGLSPFCPTAQRIHLHAARPAGVNEPAAEGVAGAEEILRLVESLGPEDLCLCLISGGGSALMPAPVEGITLADKLAVTRHLSAAGANIEQLNTVRKQLSRIKGGGLLRACRAGRLVSLVISDVLGDPLDVIASGPTVPDSSTPQAALEVLDRFPRGRPASPRPCSTYLEKSRNPRGNSLRELPRHPMPLPSTSSSATTPRPSRPPAKEARATRLLGRHRQRHHSEGPAEEIGRRPKG